MKTAVPFSSPVPEKGANVALLEKAMLLLLFGLLLAGVFLVLRPFITGLLFGSILGVSAWPARSWLVRRGMSGGHAALLLLAVLLIFVLLPISLAAPGLVSEVKLLTERGTTWLSSSPNLPSWIVSLPVVGEKISQQWQTLMSGSPEAKSIISSIVDPLWKFFSEAAVGLAASIMQLAVSLIVATTVWARGPGVALAIRDSLTRLGGNSLGKMVDVAGSAVRGVFYGVVGTAVIQGMLMAIGLALAGVPAAVPLGFVTLLLAISQLGSVLINAVWAGAAWWLYAHADPDWTIWFVAIWGLGVTFIDNFLKPWLIGSSIDMPLMLVILGVFGGFISLGFLGLFIGPALLAVAYALLTSWRSATGDKFPA